MFQIDIHDGPVFSAPNFMKNQYTCWLQGRIRTVIAVGGIDSIPSQRRIPWGALKCFPQMNELLIANLCRSLFAKIYKPICSIAPFMEYLAACTIKYCITNVGNYTVRGLYGKGLLHSVKTCWDRRTCGIMFSTPLCFKMQICKCCSTVFHSVNAAFHAILENKGAWIVMQNVPRSM